MGEGASLSRKFSTYFNEPHPKARSEQFSPASVAGVAHPAANPTDYPRDEGLQTFGIFLQRFHVRLY